MLDLINEFSKIARYEINTQKSIVFLNTNNEQSKKNLRKLAVPLSPLCSYVLHASIEVAG